MSSAQLFVNGNATAVDLTNLLIGQGVTVSNVTLNCPTGASGIFSNGNTTNLGINQGIMLTTGNVAYTVGPNISVGTGYNNGTVVYDPNLQGIESSAVYDPCILEFDVVPQCNTMRFNYVFGSEEYMEWVGAGFNDAFGFFVTGPNPGGGNYNGYNIAQIPGGIPVSIDNVNLNNNNGYYIDNPNGATIEYDGFTVRLTATVTVTPCQTYHLKLAIADAGDGVLDSGVFLEAQSFTCPSGISTSVTQPTCNVSTGSIATTVTGGNGPYTFNWSNGATAQNPTALPPGNYTVTVSDNFPCTPPLITTAPVLPAPSVFVNVFNNGPTFCPGATISLGSTSGAGTGTAAAYAWANPAGTVISNGTNATVVNAQPANSGTYRVTITFTNGCVAIGTTTVTVANPTASIAGNTQYCGQPAVLSATGGQSFLWNTGSTNFAITANAAGTYTVTVTNAGGCTATATRTLTNGSPPGITISPPPQLNCANFSVDLNASVNPAGSYNWSGPQVYGGGQTLTPSVGAIGTYVLTATGANGCSATASTAVTGNYTAPIAVVAAPAQLTCVTNQIQLNGTGSTTGAGVTYLWNGPGIAAGVNTLTPTINAPGTYRLTVTGSNGCTASAQAVVTAQAGTAIASISSPGLLSCANPSVQLNATGSSQGVNFTYAWSGPGITAGQNTMLPTVNQPGTYTITVTNTQSGCTATASVSVARDVSLPVAAAAAPTVITCLAPQVQVNGTGSTTGANITYAWNGPGIVSGNGTLTPTINAPGTYTITVTHTISGCTATASVVATQNNTVPTATAGSNSPVCLGRSIQLNGGSNTAGVTYAWTGPLAYSATGRNPDRDNAVAGFSGTYTLTVTNPANGCSATATTDVQVNACPEICGNGVDDDGDGNVDTDDPDCPCGN